MVNVHILKYPNWNKSFTSTTNASNIGIGAELSQKNDNDI